MTDMLAAAEIVEAAALDLANDHKIDPYDPERLSLADYDSALYSVTMAINALRDVKENLESCIGEVMAVKRVTVNGHTLERHVKTDRKAWDTDALRFAVADSLLVDDDGVIQDETPVDKLLHVWNLGAPRITALKARGLDADQFCEVERRPGFTIRIL